MNISLRVVSNDLSNDFLKCMFGVVLLEWAGVQNSEFVNCRKFGRILNGPR